MCQFEEGPAQECLDYKRIDISDYLKKYIVEIHNDIRNHVASGKETKGRLGGQPSAADMVQLVWDEELALMAQRWADQCIWINATLQHDICRKTDRFDVSQNILTAITTDSKLPELANLILSWYKQVGDVIPSDVKYFSGLKRGQFLIGQYTQLVWAKTEYVGCGLSLYKEPKKKYYNQRLVCNYGPAGNIIGSPIYRIGRPCSSCPSKECDRFRKSLCQGGGASAMFTRMPYNLTLDDPIIIEMHGSICFINSDGSPQQELERCFNSSEVFSNQNKTIFSTEDKTEYIEGKDSVKTVNRLSQRNKSVDKNEVNDMILLNIKQTMDREVGVENGFKEFIKNQLKFENGEVVLPNNVLFRREKGKWLDGHCRCNRIYRSSSYVYKSNQTLLCLIVIFSITKCME
ncbi:hypothetical protein JTB14_021462 [Gonioctena quinquepunctata]|nr:hypothetical protein JTB14_021462 [Gonioctena quinquepunctata]